VQNPLSPETAPLPRGQNQPPTAWIVAALLFSWLLLSGCATETKHRWLTFFFDGVPTPGATNSLPARLEEEVIATNTATVVAAAAPARPTATLHPPYHDASCTECHESKFSQKMKAPMNTVCFSCHDDFLAKAKVRHQPAESGDCASCHNPHESPFPKLLVKPVAQLCFDCHDQPDVARVDAHKKSDTSNCLACHDPHAAANEKLLKAVAAKPSGAK
jgi:predicted CXXCH cytochrome family protein